LHLTYAKNKQTVFFFLWVYGDSCKFLHAQEDYRQGWQLDKEWENVTKGKKVTGGTKIASADRNAEADNSGDDVAILENIPFACIICREPYKEPIVTRCGHYFCESCALKRYRKDPSCAACGAGTGGVFNVAKGLKKLLEKRKRERQKEEQKLLMQERRLAMRKRKKGDFARCPVNKPLRISPIEA
jgi:RING finger protein 113A